MKLNRCRQKLAVGLLALMTGVADHSLSNAQAPTTNREVTEAFSSLKSLSIQRMQELGPRGGAEVLRLRGVFLRHGDDAGRFLVTQLRQLNADEAKHVSGPDDVEGGTDYLFSLVLDGQNPFLRMQIANIMADLYPQLSPEVQTSVLTTLALSYTPSTHERQTAGIINYAFYRIGARSVPFLLGMLSNPSKFVRCNARDTLDELVPEPVRREASIPKLPCEEVLSDRSESVAAWLSWWKKKKGQIPVEEVPSFFDSVYKSPSHP